MPCPQPVRLNAIKRRLDGITHKSLADALKRLERRGLMTRTVIPTSPIGVDYRITALAHEQAREE
ncbi:winged helix-turn-helix transcriptional regulator [Sphingomonas azotifigens]|uniref:winged helix-turn-helix transcriptional regulator n=1 Tax=Sphingomonas azotifigens TaxID=330920 RepID=UPI0009FDF976|nr:winged helix-turn-helix transcriptional regulator [Sphingomonas azotifigens]